MFSMDENIIILSCYFFDVYDPRKKSNLKYFTFRSIYLTTFLHSIFNVEGYQKGGDFHAPVKNWGMKPRLCGAILATHLPAELLFKFTKLNQFAEFRIIKSR